MLDTKTAQAVSPGEPSANTPLSPVQLAALGLAGAGAYGVGRAVGYRHGEAQVPWLTRVLQREQQTLRGLGGELATQRGVGALKAVGALAALGMGGKMIRDKMIERRLDREARRAFSEPANTDLYKMSQAHQHEIQKRAAALFMRAQRGEELYFQKEASHYDLREQALNTAAWVVCAEMLEHAKTASAKVPIAIGTGLGLGGYAALSRPPSPGGKNEALLERTPGRLLAAAGLGAAGGLGYHGGRRAAAGDLLNDISETRKAIQQIRDRIPDAAKMRHGTKTVSSSLGRILSRVL